MPHIHDKVDFVSDVYIVYENKVLLRVHDKYKIWLSVGGHIELDEDPNQAAVREAKEEVGLDITIVPSEVIKLFSDSTELIPPRFLSRHHVSKTHEHISCVYFARSTSSAVQQGTTEVSDHIHWFTHQELDDPKFNVPERIRNYAHEALDALSS